MTDNQMDPEIKEAWVTALLSGKYKQGMEQLRDQTNNFCCLGVLCDIYKKTTGKGAWNLANPNEDRLGRAFRSDWHDHFDYLPPEVAEWAGLKSDPELLIDGSYSEISDVNDMGTPFVVIAELIKEQL